MARRGWVAGLAILGLAGRAVAGPDRITPLPGGINLATDNPDSGAVRADCEALVAAYVHALGDVLKETSVTTIRGLMKPIVDDTVRLEANSRAARTFFADEVERLAASPQGPTPRGRVQCAFFLGRYEQILENAPIEPLGVFARVVGHVAPSDIDLLLPTLQAARRPYEELKNPPGLRDIPPGSLHAWSAFALARYRIEKKIGALNGAAESPALLPSIDEVPMALPRYLAPAPPLEQWADALASLSRRYRFSPDQERVASSILADAQTRGREDRAERTDDLRVAEAVRDPEQRAAFLRDINRDLDEIFEEAKQRIACLATYEQYAHVRGDL